MNAEIHAFSPLDLLYCFNTCTIRIFCPSVHPPLNVLHKITENAGKIEAARAKLSRNFLYAMEDSLKLIFTN